MLDVFFWTCLIIYGFDILNLFLGVLVLNFCLRYNVHMFQQNGYKNKEHFKWLGKNFNRQRFLLLLVPAIALAFYNALGTGEERVWPEVLIAVIESIVLAGFIALEKNNTKKKLVFTNRVKRLVTCNIILIVLFTVVLVTAYLHTQMGGLLLNVESAFGETDANVLILTYIIHCIHIDVNQWFLIFIIFEPVWLVLCNILMKPVEKHINNGFIKDAKKKLKENKDLIVIGVTGSYGKTSLKFFLKELLSVKYNVLATPESFNTPMGVVKTIRESLKQTDDIFICEMGAKHVGDIKEICDIVHPDHGVITSVGPQHLETFKTIENVRKTKFELAEALPAGGKLFVNFDSEEARKQEGSYNRIGYGIEDRTGCYAKDISLSPQGTDFTVVTPDGEEERFHMRLIGYVNVLNVLGAITVAHSFGIPLEELKVPVRRLIPVSHRLELREHGNFTIIDDAYNSNPVGSKAAVETLKDFDGVRILITPGMVELGEKEDELHYKFGTYAAPCCDYILLVNRYRTKEIKRGALESGFPEDRLFEFDKFNEAMDFACTRIKDDRHRFILLENDLPDNF